MTPNSDEKESRIISGISTTIIVALLILLIYFWTLKFQPNNVLEDSGTIVSLGDPFSGGPNEVPVEPSYTPPTPSDNTPTAEEQTDDEDAVATKKTTETKTKPKENKEVKPQEKPQEEDDLIKKMREKAQKNKTNPGGSGDPNKSGGDKGDPNGSKDGSPDGKGSGNSGDGSTSGKGPGGKTVQHTFANRTIRTPSNSTNCGAAGTVKIDVILRPDGTVIVDGINPGTTSTNQCLRNLALELAKKTRFDAKEDASNVEGTITYKFSLAN